MKKLPLREDFFNFLKTPDYGGKTGEIDHLKPDQNDHLYRSKLTTPFRSKLTTSAGLN